MLIENGADVAATAYFGDKAGVTPVGLAAWEGDLATLRILLEAGASAALKPSQLSAALYSALTHHRQDKAVLLLKHGALHNIFTATMTGDADAIRRAIQQDPDCVAAQDPVAGWTPLELAVEHQQFEAADLLIEHGVEVPPQAAAAMGRIDEILSLIHI